ncbi:AHNAK, partial [Symbiodinium sp. CCMP2592]
MDEGQVVDTRHRELQTLPGLEVVLKDMGLGPHPVECDVATWLQSLPEDRSQKLEANFTEAVTRLQLAASGCPSWTSLSPVGQLLADRAFGRALPMERRSGKRSWEHWAPRPSRMEGPVKQLALDRAAKKKWADKIISVLAPYHRHFDNMQDIKPGEDKYEVWRPLVGKARVNSLKSALLYEAVDQQFTIYRLGQLWRTLHWIPQHFGGFDPTVNQAINRRYEYTRGLLVSSEAKKERRATPPPMEVVIALEKLAGTLAEGSPDGYAASFFRFCIGASARFSDTAHTRPDSMKITKDTLEFTAWQTKVKEVGDNNRPQPLIAPLVSFSQTEWWGPMIALSKRRNSLATKGLEDDYLLPVPDRDRLDFTRAPCDNSRALRWLRALLSMKGAKIPEEEVKMMIGGRATSGPPDAQLPVLASANDPQEDKRADGPAFMATNARKTGSPPVYRVHWFDRGYRCLGCGWRPKDCKSLVTFNELDWTPDYVFCAKAARAKQPPDCFLGEAVTKDSSSADPSDGLVETPIPQGRLPQESVLALINSHVIGPSQQPPFCILLGPAAILVWIDRVRKSTPTPELCPDPYKEEVMKIDEHVRLVQVPWLVLFVMGKQGFVTAQDWAGRWDEKELRKEAPKLGFSPGQNGYDEHTCVLTAIRLENAVEQFKLLKKRKMAEVDIHSVEDYKAMIGRGDRQEMRAAYLAKFGTDPEREYEGSDHMLGVLKRVLYRGEFLSGSQLDLNKVVANHPKDGEVKFQKRQSKEDDEWIHEESNRVQSEKQWKRVLMIWRTSLLMVVATCTGPSCIHLTKADLDDFYNFLFGDTIMGREPAPSLGVLMTAERKVWRQVALNMAKDETLTISAALKEIQNNSRFWSMEIDEFCLRRHHTGQPKGPRKGRGKGKDKDKGKVFQQWDYWKGKGKKPGKGKGKSKKEDWRWSTVSEETVEPPPPPTATFARTKAPHHEWAPKGSDGKEFCKKYHAFNRCPGDCGRSHNCPVILSDGKICEKNHRVPIPHVLGSTSSEFPEYASGCSSGGYHGKPSQPTVLILYAGKDDARSTKAAIAQDVLSEETFSDLCALALSADLMAIIGGMLLLYHLSLASGPRPPAFLLEHPEDPANQGAGIRTTRCGGPVLTWPGGVGNSIWNWPSLLAFFSTSGDTDGDRSIASALAPVTASTLIVRLGHRSRPLRDGGGKPSPGRLKPEDRCKCKLAWLGQWIEETLTSGTVATGADSPVVFPMTPFRESLRTQARGCPWPDQWVADLRQQLASRLSSRLHRPVSAEVSPGQPFALDILQALVELAEDPDRDFLQHLREGVPLGVDGPTGPHPNFWPSKQELGNAPKDLEPPAPTTADNYPSAEVFEDTIEKTFLEEKLLDMVAGPLSEQVFLWLLVFVDDFMAVMKESLGEIGAATLMLFLTLLGCPISWHKNALGKVNRWLGYMVNISEGSVWLPEEKLAILRPALLKLEAGELHTRKEVTSLLGKLQWVAKAYPQVSSHLQPLYAWEQKLERKCRPGDLVRFLATLLISILDSGPCVPLRLQHNTPCYGSSDAGEDDGRVAIGGWFSPLLNPTKAEVLWFSMDVLTTPWVQPLLAHTSPKRRIGALELLGTLILFLLAAESVGPCMIDAHLPLTTDNEGNAFSASKRSSKKWPCSALLMELSAQEFHKGVFAQVTHVKRSSNTWADQLTHFDFEGFSPGNRRGGVFPTGLRTCLSYACPGIVEVPQVHLQERLVEVPKVQVQEVVRTVPKVEIQTVDRIVEVPQVQLVEKLVEVPKVEIQERLHHVPKIHTQVVEKLVEVPQVQYVDKVVEVPQVQVQEVVRHVPKIETQEIVRTVPKIEIRTVEKIVEVPQVQYVEKIVEVPEVRVQEVVRHVPKIEVQEIVRHVPKIEVKLEERIVEHPQIHQVEKIVEVPQTVVQTVDRHVPKIQVQEIVKHVPKIDVRVEERIIEVPQIQHVEKVVEVPQTVVQEVVRHVPKVHVQEVVRHVPKIDVQIQEKVIEVPQVQVVEKIIEVPQTQVHEVVKHVPKLQVQEVVRHVPKVDVQVRERVVEVPHVRTVEKIVEVPKVQVQEVIRHVTVPKIETRERIVEVPCVQVQEKVVEHPEIRVQEVTKHVPKVVEVQELVRNRQRLDWTGADVSMVTAGGSLAASTLPPPTPGAVNTRYYPVDGGVSPSARSATTVDFGMMATPQSTMGAPVEASVIEVPANLVSISGGGSHGAPMNAAYGGYGGALPPDAAYCNGCGNQVPGAVPP